MTQNHPVPVPAIEWTPLHEVAAAWGSFGSQTTSHQGLDATSAAFAALTAETSARVYYTDSGQDEKHLLSALDYLHDAAQHWNTALSWLQTYREHPHPEDEDMDAQVLFTACQTAYRQYLLVGQLAVRLTHELSILTGTQVQVYVGMYQEEDAR